jgi:hypothetical protein
MRMSAEFAISAMRGVGPVRFGMTADQVAAALGPAEVSTRNAEGEIEERRGEVIVRYDPDSEMVVEVAFGPGTLVTIDTIPIMQSDDPVGVLLARSENVVECLGFLVFLDLGVTLTGYHDDDPAQRALTVFGAGRWEPLSEHFTEFAR